ncbi:MULTISPECIES: hypothetical protein [unclassified Alistipes]|jgi:uncharacterized membrane protein|uniref:hypothetical protein n=1 Tax=unclassified Alistipes TaxID=2608932 RepID=UPI000D10CA36|nr:hypothetical protein [Alistipes sp. Marseille-P5061]HIV33169.1 hypothetical protein [Candidatus Alistipes excrementigallinarum]
MKEKLLQGLRLLMMVVAIAGIIYAVEYMPSGIAVWFWVAVLGVGFVGLLYSFRVTQRRLRQARRAQERKEQKEEKKNRSRLRRGRR